jgi:hypothetical protein
MGVLELIFKKKASSAPAPRPRRPQVETAVRREVMQMAFRETLKRHGIPEQWLSMELLTASHGTRLGLHARVIVKGANRELLPFVAAFLAHFEARLKKLDPLSRDWALGSSARFDGRVQDYPDLPPPAFWRNQSTPKTVDAQNDHQHPEDPIKEGSRAWLERLLSAGGGAHQGHADFGPTQPMFDDAH